MLRSGLPERLRSPLHFLFDGRVAGDVEAAAGTIERIRADLAAEPVSYRFVYGHSEFGPARWPEQTDDAAPEELITSQQLATGASIPRRWGTFLRLCTDAFEARLILEMGTCLGISGAYMASSTLLPRLVTLEGSSTLVDIAKSTLAAISTNTEIVQGPFERTLPATLERFAREKAKIDIFYVDGHHDASATLHYVRSVIPHLAAEALVVLDDIYLYRDMWQAWETLTQTPSLAAFVNVGRFGLLVFSEKRESTRSYDLSRFTGWWRVGTSRRA